MNVEPPTVQTAVAVPVSMAQVHYLIDQDTAGHWYWVLKVNSFVIARASQSFATEAQAREEIRYVKRYASEADIDAFPAVGDTA